MKKVITPILERYGKDPTRLMDILIDVQDQLGYITDEALEILAEAVNISEADVRQTVSFYHFFSREPRGKHNIHLNTSVVALMKGREQVKQAFELAAGCRFGEVSADGKIGLYDTACIGMSDQEPAALIDGRVFTELTPQRAQEIVTALKAGKKVDDLLDLEKGEGQNAGPAIKAEVKNNIRRKGAVIFADHEAGSAVKAAASRTPEQVIEEVKKSRIRGRGGAGFPTAMKWEFCRRAKGEQRYIFCNADEGEPGTFKDRVILTEMPRLVFEGMAIAGYAVGATQGILYIRYEYLYLKQYLEGVLDEMRKNGQLGKAISGKDGFDFDIRIQFGAGAYVCGEESALIESAEGKRGEPRDRPPFPVEKGYLGQPTIVNNVETLCSVARVLVKGAAWYTSLGTSDSTGTKVLSVSGDCRYPGIYEVEWGFSVDNILELVAAQHPQAVQVGGPSGSCIGPDEYDRVLAYEDLATGGSLIIIGGQHDLLKDVVHNFTEFFIEESCGSCVPCRCLTVIYRKKLEKLFQGSGVQQDLDEMEAWAPIMLANRCGLGQTALNPILTTLKNFPEKYQARIRRGVEYDTGFDLLAAVEESCTVTGRQPILKGHGNE